MDLESKVETIGKHSDLITDLKNEIDYLKGIIEQRDNMISDLEEELRDMRNN